jgi:hypothetical protein
MQQQFALIHDSRNDALRECVAALGGAKRVGLMMRPELAADQASQWVRDRLNPDRRELFAPDQVVWILREARQVGCHAGINHIARECGYADPQPIDPVDERASLQRAFVDSVAQQKKILERMERLESQQQRPIARVA